MNGGAADGPGPGEASVELQLRVAMELFGFRVDAEAAFGPGLDTVLALKLGNLSLGDLLRFLVERAEPGRDIKLTPPWDFLNTINLHDFTFEVDLTRFRIGFRYDGIGFSTAFVSLTAVELFYSAPTADRSKSVDLSLFGSFLGIDFTQEPGLTWDVLNEPPPSVPGQGTKLFDLEYLAFGQHVTLRDITQLATIGAVIDALESTGLAPDPSKNPLTQLPALKFDGASGWLFATKFSALETVTLSAVFNDPVLYGLRVALDGKRVGKLAGLEFEILYRKISDSLGVFHTELKLPDAVRTIEMGEATVTLPIIDVDIYTNGNFLVDLGFPRNLDFSRALSVDFIVFVPIPIPVSAAVGIYFGVLSGATSDQVPQITNGRFDPVIVAGIGVRVGLGYALSLGPLQADFFAGIVGILEGVLAWFHPDADPHTTAVYVRVSGTVGIQIHIAGTVNFAILSATLDVEAYADAAAVVESYQPIIVTFEAGVSISLSVKVLFFHVQLSFSATIRKSVTIGSASPTPWVLGAPAAHPAPALLAAVAPEGITWHDRAELVSALTTDTLTLPVYVQSIVTAGRAGDHPGGTLLAARSQLVVTLFVPDTGPQSFEQLAQEAFVWSAESAALTMGQAGTPGQATTPLDTDSPVPLSHLQALYADLTDPGRPFPLSRVVDFLTARGVTFDLRLIPDEAHTPSLTVFPMPPFLTMDVDGTTVDFATGPYTAGPAYQAFVTSYFQELAAAAPSPVPAVAGPDDSVAGVLFSDYFAFLLRQLLQDALDHYASYSHPAAPTDTLDAIAVQFGLTDPAAALRIGRANQTSTTFFGAMTLTINLQSTVVQDGETLRALATRMRATPLAVARAIRDRTDVVATGAPLRITGGRAVVAADDTLATIAARLATTTDAVVAMAADVPGLLRPAVVLPLASGAYTVTSGETLAGIAGRTGLTLAQLGQAAAATAGLLLPGAGFALPPSDYTVGAAESLASVVDRFGTTLAALATTNADAPVLVSGAQATFGLTAQVRTGETLRQLGGRFGLSEYAQLATLVTALDDTVGLLAPGAAVAVTAPASYTLVDGDTLASVAAALATTTAAVAGANPSLAWFPPPIGSTITLPQGLAATVRAGDTVASIAARYGLAPVDLVLGLEAAPSPTNIDNAALLAPQASIQLPDLTHPVAAGETALGIAQNYGLTVDQLVQANRTAVGFGTVVVPDAQVVPLDKLVDALAAAGSFRTPAAALARFLLHGLRLPAPADVTGATPPDRVTLPLYPLYTLTGQQVTPPDPLPATYAITLKAAGGPGPAITFPGGGDHIAVLSDADHAALTAIDTQLAQQPPIDATPLAATPYPSVAVAPRQYALGRPIPWQAPDPAALLPSGGPNTAPVAGSPALYPFPDALRAQVAGTDAGAGLLVDLVTGVAGSPTAPVDQQPVTAAFWTTRIEFGVRRVPDLTRPGQFRPTVFEVFGTDPAATDDLEQLLSHLGSAGSGAAVTLTLLYPTSALPGATPGLRSDAVACEDVVLLKANLSTQSAPPVTAALAESAAPDPADPAASLAAAPGFLTLLWEATVTNTGGYYLLYGNAGAGLPPEIFNQDPTATVTLLATVSPAALQPFHNTAVVVAAVPDPTAAVLATPRRYTTSGAMSLQAVSAALGGLSVQALGAANVETRNLLAPDATTTVGTATRTVLPGDTLGSVARALQTTVPAVVTAIAADPVLNPGAALELYAAWLTHHGTLRAGAAGFRVVRADPDPTTTGQDVTKTKLEVLFNLIGYRLTDDPGGGFAASPDGLPLGPAQPVSGPLNHALTGDTWTYQTQVLVDRYARAGAATLGDLQDPYAGVGASARFAWQYQDVFGNRLLDPAMIDVPVRYTDELLGVSQWPALLVGYWVAAPPDPTALVVTLALDTSVYVAAPGDVFAPVGTGAATAGTAARAAAHRDRYAQVFWQLSHDLTAEITTTLDDAAPHPLAVADLADFAAAVWRYLRTVAGLAQATVVVAAGDTLGSIAAAYRVTPDELARANRSAAQNTGAANLFAPGVAVVIETRVSAIRNDTLTHIAAQATAATDTAQVAAANPGVALQAGTLIVVGAAHRVAAGETLAAVATANGLAPAQVGAANAARAGLLTAGATLTLPGGGTYRVVDGDTLAGIATRSGLAVADVATAFAATGGGPLVAGAAMTVPSAVTVAEGDTPTSLAARFGGTAAELLGANATVAALRTGARLALPGDGRYTVQAGDTAASVAAAMATTVATLADLNADSPVVFRPGALLTARYRVQSGDTFGAVAGRFGVPLAALGTGNADVVGLVAAEESVLLGSRTQPVAPGDTFASLAAAAGVSVGALGTANAGTAGLLAAGATLALPHHVRAPAPDADTHTVTAGETLGGIAAAAGVEVALLGAANADVDGLLAAGATLSYPVPGRQTYTVVTRSQETLSTVAGALQSRLAADGVAQQPTAALVAAANPGLACLAAGGVALVPPADHAVTVPVAATTERAIFPLDTALTLRRTANVDPALGDNPAVTSVSSPIAPLLPEGLGGRSAALTEFADVFEAAFATPPLKLTTTGDTASVGTPRFVAVRYGAGAALDIAIDISPQTGAPPRFFAPRPLTARPGAGGACTTSLWSSAGPIPITDYVSGTGPAAQPRSMAFTGVDLDVWGRRFLTQLDLLLSGDYAVPAYRLNPASYGMLLAAKQTLAEAIGASVAPITAPGAASPAELDAARTALQDRLLTTLAEAYQVDAIVTVPVAVTAPPGGSPTTAPRVHGHPVGTLAAVPAGQYKTVVGDTLASIAAGRSTVWALGVANAHLVGLLAVGVALPLPDGEAYRTAPGDTLASIADQHDLALGDLLDTAAAVGGLLVADVVLTLPDATLRSLAAGFGAPVPLLVTLLADTSTILLPGAVVTGPWTYPVAAGDTLAAIAARFRRGVGELGTALAAVPGLLAAGVAILPSQGGVYTTRAGDTLAGIATALGVPVADVAAAAAQVPDLLVPGVAITLPPTSVVAGDTLTGIAARFPVTTADLGAALADTPGLLQYGAGANLVVRTATVAEGDTALDVLAVLALDVGTPETVAAATADLAALNADTPNLLVAGTVLNLPEPVTVVDGDTLATLANAHELTPFEVTTAIAARTDVLRPGTVIALDGQVLTVGAADSLAGLAASAGLGLDVFSAAAQSLPDLLRPGVVVALRDPEVPGYVVAPGATLDGIAAHVGHGVTPAWILSAILTVADALSPGATLRYLSRVPGFTLSDTAVALSGSQVPMAFLLHTASNVAFDSLAIDLTFPVNQLEYDITDVPWAQGYQASHWLTFLRPPTQTDIGRIEIPIPLRTFPVPPSVTGQRTTTRATGTVVSARDTLRTITAAVGARTALTADALLAPGSVLRLPTADRVRARPGETTADLAARLGVPAELATAAARCHGAFGLATAHEHTPLAADAIVPVPRIHRVRAGESLAAVAAHHRVPAEQLLAHNADTPGLLQLGSPVAATATPSLQDLRRYDYDATFDVHRAAQDTVTTGYVQNVPPDAATIITTTIADADTGGDLGGYLAKFATVETALATDLALILAVDPLLPAAAAQTRNPAAFTALTFFAPLALRIAADWASWVATPAQPAADPGPAAPGSAPPHDLRFTVRRATSMAGEPTARLLVPHGPVAAQLADEQAVTATSTSAAADTDTVTLALADRDVITTQNIWGRLSLTRNATLITGVPTSSAFVYSVPDVRMPQPATPLITSTDPYALTDIPFAPASAPPVAGSGAPQRRPLVDWLVNFFDSLLNRYAVLATDTLQGIALRYGLGIADLTPAVADIPGLLVAGTRLALPGGSYTCTGTDTLRGIATTASAALGDVVDAAAALPGALVASTLLRPAANARYLRVSVDYAFVVAADPTQNGEIVSRLPVFLRPTSLFDSATDLGPDTGFCADLARALTAWAADRGVPDDVGLWLLGVSLYTTLADPAAAVPAAAPPLLQLDNLRLPRDRVTPTAGPIPEDTS